VDEIQTESSLARMLGVWWRKADRLEQEASTASEESNEAGMSQYWFSPLTASWRWYFSYCSYFSDLRSGLSYSSNCVRIKIKYCVCADLTSLSAVVLVNIVNVRFILTSGLISNWNLRLPYTSRHYINICQEKLLETWVKIQFKVFSVMTPYDGVFKSFRTGRLEQELQMIQLSATRCSCIAILRVSLVIFAAITLCIASQWVFIVVYFIMTQSGNFWIYSRIMLLPPSSPAKLRGVITQKTLVWIFIAVKTSNTEVSVIKVRIFRTGHGCANQ
jgi:hypothetical protein